ncbi:MAG: hypothetical protein KDN19_22185, partial [Verrucomicrobiae bacterium]|nr:hypothetical protein [Verrucomicrobiae bacterium]
DLMILLLVPILGQVLATWFDTRFRELLATKPKTRFFLLVSLPLWILLIVLVFVVLKPVAQKGEKKADQALEIVDALQVKDKLLTFSTNPDSNSDQLVLAPGKSYPVELDLPENAEILTAWSSFVSRNGRQLDDASFDVRVSKDRKEVGITVSIVDPKPGNKAEVRIHCLYTVKPPIATAGG